MPAGASVSKNKANGANGPVNIHGDPNAHHTHAKIFGKQIPKADAEDPHGKNGNHHAEFYIVGSAQRIGQRKRQRPDQNGRNAMRQDDLHCNGAGNFGKVVEFYDHRHSNDYQNVGYKHG